MLGHDFAHRVCAGTLRGASRIEGLNWPQSGSISLARWLSGAMALRALLLVLVGTYKAFSFANSAGKVVDGAFRRRRGRMN